ncbi:hypothetical protein NL676_020315 [Syzygium grande]|nr:hypothetical protein NL676_020315 [Syzygium grande]
MSSHGHWSCQRTKGEDGEDKGGGEERADHNALFSVSSLPKPIASSANFQTFGPEEVLKKVGTSFSFLFLPSRV